jgi:hypothetical protein
MRKIAIVIAAALAAAAPAFAEGARPAKGPRVARQRRPTPAVLVLQPVTHESAVSESALSMGSAPLDPAGPAHVFPEPERSPRQAWRVTGGIPLTWRSAAVRPDSGLGLEFRTDTPYLGLDLEGQAFPQRAFPSSLPAWAEPLGLSLSASQRALTSRLGAEEIGSREQRVALDALYEPRLRLRTRITGRAGWAWHRFAVDETAVIQTVSHHGPRIGIDAAHPLHPRVEAIAGLRLMPWAAVGGAEARARGEDSDAWGMEAILGAAGAIPRVRGLGWRVAYDYVRFSDTYAGAGQLSSGGSGSATHHAILVGASWVR